MRRGLIALIGAACALVVGGASTVQRAAGADPAPAATPIYLDTSYSFQERAADLVSRMTLQEKASQAVSKLRQPELTVLWQRFLDDELEESDFPAWLLLQEPGLALPLAEDLATGAPAEESYRCVHRWIHARRAKKQTDELALRKNLQSLHPALFRLLKQSV